jgi:hypothetical protein
MMKNCRSIVKEAKCKKRVVLHVFLKKAKRQVAIKELKG